MSSQTPLPSKLLIQNTIGGSNLEISNHVISYLKRLVLEVGMLTKESFLQIGKFYTEFGLIQEKYLTPLKSFRGTHLKDLERNQNEAVLELSCSLFK